MLSPRASGASNVVINSNAHRALTGLTLLPLLGLVGVPRNDPALKNQVDELEKTRSKKIKRKRVAWRSRLRKQKIRDILNSHDRESDEDYEDGGQGKTKKKKKKAVDPSRLSEKEKEAMEDEIKSETPCKSLLRRAVASSHISIWLDITAPMSYTYPYD